MFKHHVMNGSARVASGGSRERAEGHTSQSSGYHTGTRMAHHATSFLELARAARRARDRTRFLGDIPRYKQEIITHSRRQQLA